MPERASRVPSITNASMRRSVEKEPGMIDMANLAAHLKTTAPIGVPVTGAYFRQRIKNVVTGVCSPRDYPQEALLSKIDKALRRKKLKFDDVFPNGKLGRSELLRAHGSLFGKAPQRRPATAPSASASISATPVASRMSTSTSVAPLKTSTPKLFQPPPSRQWATQNVSTPGKVAPPKGMLAKNYAPNPLEMSTKQQVQSVYGYLRARKMSPIMKSLVDTAPGNGKGARHRGTYRNLTRTERFNELKAGNPILGRLTEETSSNSHLAQMLGNDVRFRRPYGLHFIRRNELLRIKAVIVPACQMWLCFKCCHILLATFREVLSRHIEILRADDFVYDESVHLDLRPTFVDSDAEVDSTFSWGAAQIELANPRMLLLKLQTIVHIVHEYGLEPSILAKLDPIIAREIFMPHKIESVSLACAHLCQWVLDVVDIAKRHDEGDDDETFEALPHSLVDRNQLAKSQTKVRRPVGEYEFNASLANGRAAIQKRNANKGRVFMVYAENSALGSYAFKACMGLIKEQDRVIVMHSFSSKSKLECSNNQLPESTALRFRFDLKAYSGSRRHEVLCMERPEGCSLKEHMAYLASTYEVDYLVCGVAESDGNREGSAVSTLGSTTDLTVKRAFCNFVGVKMRCALRGPGAQHFLVPVDGSEETHDGVEEAAALLAPGDRLSLLYIRTAHPLAITHRWSTVKARYEIRNLTTFVVDVMPEETKTTCLLRTLDVLRPNFVVMGVEFELQPGRATDQAFKVLEDFSCSHGFHTIVTPSRSKEFRQAREKDHQFPILGEGGDAPLAKMVY